MVQWELSVTQGWYRVTQVLHKVCEGWDGCLGGLCWQGCRVNQVDEGLGQPQQVMTAGTHGPSGQSIFDIGSIESYVHVKQYHLEVVSSRHSGCLSGLSKISLCTY